MFILIVDLKHLSAVVVWLISTISCLHCPNEQDEDVNPLYPPGTHLAAWRQYARRPTWILNSLGGVKNIF